MEPQQIKAFSPKPITLESEFQSGNPETAHAYSATPTSRHPQALILPVFIPLLCEKEKKEFLCPCLERLSYRAAKPTFDILLIVLCMPLWLPLCLIIALVIWLQDGANPLFFQNRIGKNGRIFKIWKFRTMVTNADDVLREKLLACAESRREWNERHKLKNDPRITCAGKILRRFSLDELPQLANVLLGHMSLIGPRPLPPNHHAKLSQSTRAWREKVKPGITGPWQVSGRSDIGNRGMELWDPFYVRHWSLWLDMIIFFRTFKVVTRGIGAY